METGSGRLVTTSLLEPLTGQTSRRTASQESLSMNVAGSWNPGAAAFNNAGIVGETFSGTITVLLSTLEIHLLKAVTQSLDDAGI